MRLPVASLKLRIGANTTPFLRQNAKHAKPCAEKRAVFRSSARNAALDLRQSGRQRKSAIAY
jgi:hypothetical protein